MRSEQGEAGRPLARQRERWHAGHRKSGAHVVEVAVQANGDHQGRGARRRSGQGLERPAVRRDDEQPTSGIEAGEQRQQVRISQRARGGQAEPVGPDSADRVAAARRHYPELRESVGRVDRGRGRVVGDDGIALAGRAERTDDRRRVDRPPGARRHLVHTEAGVPPPGDLVVGEHVEGERVVAGRRTRSIAAPSRRDATPRPRAAGATAT
jgi:hypothetical protein